MKGSYVGTLNGISLGKYRFTKSCQTLPYQLTVGVGKLSNLWFSFYALSSGCDLVAVKLCMISSLIVAFSALYAIF